MFCKSSIWLIICAVSSATEISACGGKGCTSAKIRGMRAVDCYDKDLTKVPQCLRTDLEILDLSYNRIRMLRENDLSRYSSLKFLYLTDNMINKIHQDAFFYNTDLRVLDLSLNGIIKLPPQVLQLPSLEKLFLSKNANMNIIDAVDKAKPISSPLKELDIGFNEIDTLPDFGMMPHLVKLNITGNPEVEMSLKSFAGLCNLQILSMDNVTAVFEDPCECWILEKWLRDRNVMFSSWECPSLEEDDCTMRVPGHHLKTFSQCKDKYDKIILNSKLIKILVPIAVAILILLLAAAYIIVKRKRRQAKMLRMKCASVDGQTLIR